MQLQRMIWFAIAVSTLFYGAIVFMVANHPSATFDAAVRSPMILGPYGVATLMFLLGLVWPMISSASPARVRMIVRMALFEACAMMGVWAAFVAKDFRMYLAPWALAAMGFFLAFPTAERQS